MECYLMQYKCRIFEYMSLTIYTRIPIRINILATFLADWFQPFSTAIASPFTSILKTRTQLVRWIRFRWSKFYDGNPRAVKPRPAPTARRALDSADAVTAAALIGDETDPTITFLPRACSAKRNYKAFFDMLVMLYVEFALLWHKNTGDSES